MEIDYNRLYKDVLNKVIGNNRVEYTPTKLLSKDQKMWISYFISLESAESIRVVEVYYSDFLSYKEVGELLGTSDARVQYYILKALLAVAKNIFIVNKSEFLTLEMRAKMQDYSHISIAELSTYYDNISAFTNIFRRNDIYSLQDLFDYPRCIYCIRGVGNKAVAVIIKRLNELGIKHNFELIKRRYQY